jgi:hypothetical protein
MAEKSQIGQKNSTLHRSRREATQKRQGAKTWRGKPQPKMNWPQKSTKCGWTRIFGIRQAATQVEK